MIIDAKIDKAVFTKFTAGDLSLDVLDSDEQEHVLQNLSKRNLIMSARTDQSGASAMVARYLFRETKSTLDFYLPEDMVAICPLEQLAKRLKNPVTVHALFDRIPDEESHLYQVLQHHVRRTGEGAIAVITPKSKKKIRSLFEDNKIMHFMVSDQQRYAIIERPETNGIFASFDDTFSAELMSKEVRKACDRGLRIL